MSTVPQRFRKCCPDVLYNARRASTRDPQDCNNKLPKCSPKVPLRFHNGFALLSKGFTKAPLKLSNGSAIVPHKISRVDQGLHKAHNKFLLNFHNGFSLFPQRFWNDSADVFQMHRRGIATVGQRSAHISPKISEHVAKVH